jgi:hypothetical protein
MSLTLPLSVHSNKAYPSNEVRHFREFPEIQSSSSGQYGSKNFPELTKRIQTASKQGKIIYFVDTRNDLHFELNGSPVRLEKASGRHITSKEIVDKETQLVRDYLKQYPLVKFEDDRHGKTKEEVISNASTVQQFIETSPNFHYMRFALEEHGPLTDAQVDQYLSILEQFKKEDAWMHTNSIVGGAAAILLIVLREMIENAPNESLEAVLNRNEKFKALFKEPKSDDENKELKIARNTFIKEFYTYAATLPQHKLSWTDWKVKSN